MNHEIDEMETEYSEWMLRYLPKTVRAKAELEGIPDNQIWTFGYNRNGDAILTPGESSNFGWEQVEGWFTSNVPWVDDNALLWWAKLAGCWQCNENEESDQGEGEPGCESCNGEGFILYDCINDLRYIESALEDSSTLSTEQIKYLKSKLS